MALSNGAVGLLITVFVVLVLLLPVAVIIAVDKDALGRLRDARAGQLALRAKRRRPDGSRGPRARRALRALARRARRGHGHAALYALHGVWLARPDDQAWALLDDSYRTSGVLAVAVNPALPEDTRSAVGAFCTARGVAPPQASQRALVFLLTGQRAQHRAWDPDGSPDDVGVAPGPAPQSAAHG